MGTKEGTYCTEHRVPHANNESWNATSKTNDAMYGDQHNKKKEKKKKDFKSPTTPKK